MRDVLNRLLDHHFGPGNRYIIGMIFFMVVMLSFIVAWAVIWWLLNRHEKREETLDTEGIVLNGATAFCAALFWPLILFGGLVYLMVRAVG